MHHRVAANSRWTAPEKARMVEETFEPGMTVSLGDAVRAVDN
jgi:transposase-like protein